jgi:hypothetical protein
VDALEQDAFEVLRLVRSIKNTLAPINRVPPEILSLIPGYFGGDDGDGDGDDMDEVIITLTHVCRDWRDIFISRSSLWTRFDFTNIEKTRTYIQRSQSSPLNFSLDGESVINDAFSLVIPHTHRLKSLTIRSDTLPSVLEHLRCHTPLLEKLDIRVSTQSNPAFDGALFGGDLSSLHELRLERVTTDFPWNNLANLRVVSLESGSHKYGTTQILDFFESAPLLCAVSLQYQMPDLSDAPPERIVPLRHLKVFAFIANPPQSILLHHLCIPIGASLISGFEFKGDGSPLLDYLPERSPNFNNLNHITSINLSFSRYCKHTRLEGPSGSLHVLANRVYRPSDSIDHKILRSFGHPILSTIQRLAISEYNHERPTEVEECPIFQTLSPTDNLQTLILIDCKNLPFILALDPEQNPSNLVLCPNMEELVFHVEGLDLLPLKNLFNMAKNRALGGARLSSITLVNMGSDDDEERVEVLKLREHVTHVQYRLGDSSPPDWDHVPGENGDERE